MKQIYNLHSMNWNKYYLQVTESYVGDGYYLYYKTEKYYACLDVSPVRITRFPPYYCKSLERFYDSLDVEFAAMDRNNTKFYEFDTRQEAKYYVEKLRLKSKLCK